MRYIILFVSLIGLSINAFAKDNLLNSENLTQNIKSFLHSTLTPDNNDNLDIHVRSLDHRIKLKSCEDELDYQLPNYGSSQNNRMIVKISCNNPYWDIYVPVTIKTLRPIAITTRPLSRHEILSASDVTLKEMDISTLNQGFFEDLDVLIGQEVNFSIRAGSVLVPRSVSKPKVILRGDLVTIFSESTGLIVRTHGVAQEPGALGESIKIKNSNSQKIVEGIIMGAGQIKVPI